MNKNGLWQQIKRFCIGGGVGFIAYYVALYLCTEFIGVAYETSSKYGAVVNFTVNFFILKFWVFRNNEDRKAFWNQLLRYLAVAVAFFLVNPPLLHFLVDRWGLHYLVVSGILSFAVYIPLSFVLTRWIFAKK